MKYFFLTLFFLNSFNINSDTLFFKLIKEREFKKAINYAKTNNDQLLVLLSELLYYDGEKENILFTVKNVSTKLNNKEKEIVIQLIKGFKKYIYKSDNAGAFIHFYNAFLNSEKIKNFCLLKYSLIAILDLYRKEIFIGNNQYSRFLEKFGEIKSDIIDEFIFSYYNLVFYTKTIYNIDPKYQTYLKRFDSIYKTHNFNKNFSVIYLNEKALENRINKNYNNSLSYLKKAINLTTNLPYQKGNINAMHLNIADIYLKLNDALNAKIHFDKSKLYHKKDKRLYDSFYYHRYLSDYYLKIVQYDSAYYHLNKSINIEYDLNYRANTLEISQLNKLYDTEKKEKEIVQQKQQILESEAKRKQNAYLFYGALAFLFLGSIIAFLSLKNSHRKRQLAEQQKELETQKNLTLIKEQEITSINAMVEGQEKERKRIAEDLHDNIGSVLATLKLHFENLKLNREKKHFNQEELYKKTEKLIDETYLKVRNLAHVKNAGVIANQGLLVAVKVMADKISSANKTNIEVVHFGLNKRLENSLELSIFRIIQELTTNIIKHAEATQATINISQFNGDLNLIIEDNGKGFVLDKIASKKGMGLNSITTRIDHLNGSIEIDSTIHKGTSIIINLPTQ